MKLWGWTQDNISDSDIKIRIIGVQTKMQTLVSSMDFSFPLYSRAMCSGCSKECQSFCHCSSRYTIRQGCKPPLGKVT